MGAILAFLSSPSVRAEDVAELAALLGTGRAGEAAMKLADMGPAAKDAVPQLVRALRNTDDEVRWRVAWSLSRVGPDAAAAAPELIRLMGADLGMNHHAARIALRRIGPGATTAVLGALKAAPDTIFRYDVGSKRMLDETWRMAKGDFVELLLEIGADPAASVPVLAELLDNEEVSFEALEALARMGACGSAALPALAARYPAWADKSSYRADRLLDTMVAMGDPAVATLAALATAKLTDSSRGSVIGAMARIPGPGVAAARPLLEANSIRAEFDGALSQIAMAGPYASDLVPLLEKQIARWRGPENSAAALLVLGDAGVEALERLIFKTDAELKTELARQLCRTSVLWFKPPIYPPGRLPCPLVEAHPLRVGPLLLRLGHPTDPAAAKPEILYALTRIPLEGADARQAVILASVHLKGELAVEACALAGSLGAPAASLADRMKQMLKERDRGRRVAAATALFELGKGGRKEAEVILGALEEVVEAGDYKALRGMTTYLSRAMPPALPGFTGVAKVLGAKVVSRVDPRFDDVSDVAGKALACLLPVIPKADRAQFLDLVCKDYEARELAAWSVAKAGDFDVFPLLLGRENAVVDGLAIFGRTSRKTLEARLDDKDAEVRQLVARALLRADPSKAGDRAYQVGLGEDESCDFDDELVAQYRALGVLAMPALTKGLESANATTRARCAIMLGALGDRTVAQAVRAALDTERSWTRDVALRVLDSLLSE